MAKDKRTSIYFDRKKIEFVGLEVNQIQQFKDAYPDIDVDSELKKMGLWLTSPRGKKRKGNLGFIINWLNNAIPKENKSIVTETIEIETPLRPLIQEYLRDLWKGNEHILELNKKKN